MKCTHCGANNRRAATVCSQCGRSLKVRREETPPPKKERTPVQKVFAVLLRTLFVLVTIVSFGFLFYRAYYWFHDWWMARSYTSGRLREPLVDTITLADGQLAHSLVFFGNDGDQLFLEQTGRSYVFSGGTTRIEIPDSYWFEDEPEDVESAQITLTPVIHREDGGITEIPVMELDIDTPESPITLVDPDSEWSQVLTSIYPLSIRVVPGSQVLIGGENVTDQVDFQGNLTVNINVYPQGDNQVSVLVTTPHHRQTRKDLILYREYQEINLEPSLNLNTNTNKDTVIISGEVDPQATFSVDTPYVDGSIQVDPNGKFRFTAKVSQIGDNIVTFRATQEGKIDSVVSVHVYYVPMYNVYVNKAWAMDYEQLSLYYETWHGRIFLCKGPIVSIEEIDSEEMLIMNVGDDDNPQYVLLENHSTIHEPVIGQVYRAYADVLGNKYYAGISNYCPMLAARYMTLVEPAD